MSLLQPSLGRYFPGEDPHLSSLLDGYLARIASDLGRQGFASSVRVLLLAGGYGRGEGGIFVPPSGGTTQLYNDLEFYLIVGPGTDETAVNEWCGQQSHAGEHAIGIEVEFKILAENAFLEAEPTMFYYDLLAAHRVIYGQTDFAADTRPELRDPTRIPQQEATRLLFNRGTGLFFSMVALHDEDERITNGFVERNHAKVRLALGDAVLATQGLYHYSCQERQRRLDQVDLQKVPPDWARITAWHAEGVEFKLHPRHRHPSKVELRATQDKLAEVWMNTFLWVERLRLGIGEGAGPYAQWSCRLYPETSVLKNLALHLRDRIKRGAALPEWTDYPRASLQRALTLFLVGKPAAAARFLGVSGQASLRELESAYARWWRYYN